MAIGEFGGAPESGGPVLSNGLYWMYEAGNAALQPAVVDSQGISKYFTQCGCGWCGLRVEDPELARREYDKHPCTIGLAFEPGLTGRGAKEPLPIDWAQTTKDLLERKLGSEAAPVVTTTEVDGTERRFQLMELK